MNLMKKSTRVLFFILTCVVLVASFFIVKAFTRPPQKALDFAYARADGSVSGLFDEARDSGAVLIFFDPEVEGSNDVLTRVISGVKDAEIVAVSVSTLDAKKQLELLPDNAKALKNLCFVSEDIVKLYNIGNAPVTYFIDSEFYVTDAFVGNIKDKTIQKCAEQLN